MILCCSLPNRTLREPIGLRCMLQAGRQEHTERHRRANAACLLVVLVVAGHTNNNDGDDVCHVCTL